MLIAYWTRHCPQQIVRMQFLSPLLSDSYHHIHNGLCASTLSRKTFVMPFNRDVLLTLERVNVMYNILQYCLKTRGCLLMTPEHRMSFELKRSEIEMSNCVHKREICKAMDAIIVDLNYIDMLDECDEILRHR
jgi:hypothetical protein